MTFVQRALAFLDMFSVGIMQPVLSLVLLDHGATLSTLPLMLGIYSLTVLLMELPSGVFADIKGRKTSFIASIGFFVMSMVLLLFSKGLPTIAVAMLFQGLGRSFSSGSYDALVIDDCIERHGTDWSSKASSQLAVHQSIGISLGALAGGMIPETKGYSLHLLSRLFILLVILALSVFLVKESRGHKEKEAGLMEHLKGCASLVKNRPVISLVLMGVLATGGLMLAIEVYWQPAYRVLSDAGGLQALGFICFLGYGAAAFGNLLAHRSCAKENRLKAALLFSRISIGIMAVILAVQRSSSSFIAAYGSVYLLLGVSEIFEKGLINGSVPSDKRASMLSLMSLSMQVGGFLGSGLMAAIISRAGIGGSWIVSGTVLVLVSLTALILHPRARSAQLSRSGPCTGASMASGMERGIRS